MSVTESEIYDIATRLGFAQPAIVQNEASARSAVSRGYYAAFHATVGAFRDAKNKPLFDPSHAAWALWLRDSHDTLVREIGTNLEELRQLRVDADYKLAETLRSGGLVARLKDAQFIVNQKDGLRSRLARDQRQPPANRKDNY